MRAIWHDLECGGYAADLPLWRGLAAKHPGDVLDVGAGAGRVALDLARRGHPVTALDADADLLAELSRRAGHLPVETIRADARRFDLCCEFALCLVPMQTIQLLGGPVGRASFLHCAARHLRPGGMLAVALAEDLETYEVPGGTPPPLPDLCERDGVVFSSQPVAIRAEPAGFVLERRRETISPTGDRSLEHDRVVLDYLTAGELEGEATAAGLRAAGRRVIPATREHAGSRVVMLRA